MILFLFVEFRIVGDRERSGEERNNTLICEMI